MTVLLSILGFLLYFGIGILFSFLRWQRFFNSEMRFYEQVKRTFLRSLHIEGTEIPEFVRPNWRNLVAQTERLNHIPPKFQEYRSTLALNVMLWPLSLGSIAVQAVYGVFMGRLFMMYMSITKARVDQIEKDLKG